MTLRLHPGASSHSGPRGPDDERNPSVTGPALPSFHGPTRGTARAGDDQGALALGSCGPRHLWPWAPARLARDLRCHWPRPRYGGLRGRLAQYQRGQPRYDHYNSAGQRDGDGSPGSGGTGSGGTGSGGTAPGGALVEYARCMRAHGVSSFPEPGSLSAPDAIRNFKGEIVQAVGRPGFITGLSGRATGLRRVLRPADAGASASQPSRDAEASGRVPLRSRPRGTGLSRPQSHHRQHEPSG
jgi:hypothetical protein